jgi:hypothetical protein
MFIRSLGLFLLLFLNYKISATCVSGNCINGKGTYVYQDKSRFSGTFLGAKPHGQGTYYHADGSVYSGSFHQGLKHGTGKMVFRSKDVYTGQFSKGMITGKGKMTYISGDTYVGEWVNGKASGLGKYTFTDGDIYEGGFVNGVFAGIGKMSRPNGSYYHGDWVNNKKHGQGVAYENGKKSKVWFEDNNLVREETISSSPIVTEVKKQQIPTKILDCNKEYCHNVEGSLRYKDGSVYTGYFVNDKGEGEGQCMYANGDKYKGGWKNHAPHGEGTMTFANGNVYTSLWDQGKPVKKQDIATTKNKVPKSEPKPSAPKSENETKIFALIAGVATYQHMPSLKYTDDDAYQLFAFLKSPEGGAIPDDQIKVIIDDAVTRQSLLQELHTIAAKADENDVVLLYLSGHGLDGAYVPSDFDGYKNHVTYEDILEVLDESPAKHKLFIADACHSGSMLAQARSPYNVALEHFYSAYNTVKGGTAVMMSSKKEEVSLEYGGLRQGIFSHFLIKGLKGPADLDGSGLITVSELYQYIHEGVKEYTANAQNPVIMGDFDANMPVSWVRKRE